MTSDISIMIIDDEPNMLQELGLLLESVGNYRITACDSGHSALKALTQEKAPLPALIISDVSMPEMDGYTLGHAIRENAQLKHIPLLYLTAKTAVNDRIDARKITPHYFPKDGDRRELLMIIQSILEENMIQVGINPLTHLPGNTAIEHEVSAVISSTENAQLFYIDFDNFKAYNDAYGTHAGDKAIQEVALGIDRALRHTAHGKYFLGHIGGDDFIGILHDATDAPKVYAAIGEEVEKVRTILYSEADIARGYFQAKNRAGETENYGLLSVSIGALKRDSLPRSQWDILSEQLAEIKKKAKARKGNSYIIE